MNIRPATAFQDEPSAGFNLDQVSQPIYVFAPTSKHENQIVVHINNPLPQDIPYTGHEMIELMVSTTSPGAPNPDALTTPNKIALITAQQVHQDADGAWLPVPNPNWVMQQVSKENDRYVFRLTPSPTNPPTIVLHDQGMLSISLAHVVTSLTGKTGQIELAARNFQGLNPLSFGACAINIDAYPAPQGNLSLVQSGILDASKPLLANWATSFVDALTIEFIDVAKNITTLSMAKGQIGATEISFTVLPEVPLGGWLRLTGTNDSNATSVVILQRVDVQGQMTVTGRIRMIDFGWVNSPPPNSGAEGSPSQWSVVPSALNNGQVVLGSWSPQGNPDGGGVNPQTTPVQNHQVPFDFVAKQIPRMNIAMVWTARVWQTSSNWQEGLYAVTVELEINGNKLSPMGVFGTKYEEGMTPPCPIHQSISGVLPGNMPSSIVLDADDSWNGGMGAAYTVTVQAPYQVSAGDPP